MRKKRANDIQALHSGALKALKKAVAKAIAQHKLAGVPAVIWRDGKVVRLSGRRAKGSPDTLKKLFIETYGWS